MRKLCPLRCHEIDGLNRAERHDIFVGTPVTHHANGLYRQKYRKCLRRLVVPARSPELVDKNRIGVLKEIRIFTLHLPEDPHAEAGPRERVPENHVPRQPEREAELTYFVLEELPQRLEKLQMQRLG